MLAPWIVDAVDARHFTHAPDDSFHRRITSRLYMRAQSRDLQRDPSSPDRGRSIVRKVHSRSIASAIHHIYLSVSDINNSSRRV
jgi:hypothetical protein